jgi:hypothetical protein
VNRDCLNVARSVVAASHVTDMTSTRGTPGCSMNDRMMRSTAA